MPTKPRVEPDLPMARACRLLEAIRAAVPVEGRAGKYLRGWTARKLLADAGGPDTYTAAEYRAAINVLRECGALQYSRGIYTRGQMF